ncbi:hypothetical protein OE88DRAFT_1642925 [Heliocybe sulcata]|uniref:Uncharacterized protein n=1 Tax=Heliocybe sulcata TaxID=5364 RepID=A0A5C3NAL6_9AGAM|nr:hypothetical protein OE88DRAFT_1642925 [Heliocybe sulcata]
MADARQGKGISSKEGAFARQGKGISVEEGVFAGERMTAMVEGDGLHATKVTLAAVVAMDDGRAIDLQSVLRNLAAPLQKKKIGTWHLRSISIVSWNQDTLSHTLKAAPAQQGGGAAIKHNRCSSSIHQQLLDSIRQPGYSWVTALPVDVSEATSAPATAAYSASSSATRPLSSSWPTYIQSEQWPAPRHRCAALDFGLGVGTSLSNDMSLTEAPAVVPHAIVPVI